MGTVYNYIHSLFASVPEIALFLSLALGYYIGKINFGKFQLGGVAGSLLAAVLVSQFGVHVDDGVKNVLFALFIYAVGYTSGSQFFHSLGRQSFRGIVLAVVLAVSALATVIVLARLFNLDKGLAAGIAAGGLTQSAIIGTAESAIHSLNLAADETARLVGNISVGYGVTYIFGSFGTIFVCVNILQKFMGKSIRDDAIKAEAALHSNGLVLGEGQKLAVPVLTGRIFYVGASAGKTVGEFEQSTGLPAVTIERVKRQGAIIGLSSQLELEENDKVLLVGQRDSLLNASKNLGAEVSNEDDMEILLQERRVFVSNEKMHGRTFREIRDLASQEMRHGLYVIGLERAGSSVALTPETVVLRGDVIILYGAEQDIRRAAVNWPPFRPDTWA